MSAHLDDVLTKALRASSTKVEHPEIERLRAKVAALEALVKAIDAAMETDRVTAWTSQPLFSVEERFDAWKKVHDCRVALAELEETL